MATGTGSISIRVNADLLIMLAKDAARASFDRLDLMPLANVGWQFLKLP